MTDHTRDEASASLKSTISTREADDNVALAEREAMSTALETVDDATVSAFIAENMEMLKGQRVQFPVIKIAHAGARAFKVEDLDSGEFDLVPGKDGLVANVIAADKFRMYYAKKYNSSEIVPPDCMSVDLTEGKGNPGGACSDCPMNQWESATNADGDSSKGKACKEMIRLFLMLEGCDIPYQLVLPPSSIKSFSKYAGKQLVKKKPVQLLWTRFYLDLGMNDCSLLNPVKDADHEMLKSEFQVAMDIRRTYGAAIAERDLDQLIAAARASSETGRRREPEPEPAPAPSAPVAPSGNSDDVPF